MLKESDFVKIRTAVPTSAADAMREALGKVGAGEQGNYSFCSSSIKSQGRFLPLAGARPAVGKVGELTMVEEEIIETICHKDKLVVVVAALKAAHPYEEPPIDITPRFELI